MEKMIFMKYLPAARYKLTPRSKLKLKFDISDIPISAAISDNKCQ